jgi:hypothetical protein
MSDADGDVDNLSEVGVGDGREKHVHVVTGAGKEFDHEGVFLRYTETEFLVSPDLDFRPADTTRYRKSDVDRVSITQHHSNCFITTAAAGEGPTLDALRGFREEVMVTAPVGRGLLSVYDTISPPVATTLAGHPDATATRLIRGLVERCGALADARDAASTPVGRAGRSVALVCLYVVGVCLSIVAHGWLRASELS